MRAAGRVIDPVCRSVARRRRRHRPGAGRQPARQPEGRPRVAGGDRSRCSTTRSRRWPARSTTTHDAVRAVRRRPVLPARLPAVLRRPRGVRAGDGPPPAGVRGGPRGGPEPVRRHPAPVRRPGRVRVHPDEDVQGLACGADARGHLLGVRPPHDRHRQHRDRRDRRADPVDPVRRAALDADQRDAERRRGDRAGLDRVGVRPAAHHEAAAADLQPRRPGHPVDDRRGRG